MAESYTQGVIGGPIIQPTWGYPEINKEISFQDVFIDLMSSYKKLYESKADVNHVHPYLPLEGGTVTGTVIFSKRQDAEGTKDYRPALIVGGAPNQTHLEMDDNELMAKKNATTTNTLWLNANGGTVSIGSGGLTIGKPLAVDYGGTGVTTKKDIRETLFPDNLKSTGGYLIAITSSWNDGGYIRKADALEWIGAASASHNHDSAYAAIGHNHSGVYAAANHNHDSSYASISHNHSGVYAAASHTHSYLPLSGGTLTGNLNFKRTSVNVNTIPSSNLTHQSVLYGTDGTEDKTISYTQTIYYATSGLMRNVYAVKNWKDDGATGVTNYIYLDAKKDGTLGVSVPAGAKTPWVTAIGAAAASEIADSGWKEGSDSSVFSGKVRYRKVGKVLFIYIDWIKMNTAVVANSTTKLITLPSEYIPALDCSMPLAYPNGAAITITKSTGAVNLKPSVAINTSTYIFGQAVCSAA